MGESSAARPVVRLSAGDCARNNALARSRAERPRGAEGGQLAGGFRPSPRWLRSFCSATAFGG
jgi:hypothetical protein